MPSACEVDDTGESRTSALSRASFPPIETTTCVTSADTRAICDARSRVVAPSTAKSEARHPLGRPARTCVITSGAPAVYEALSKTESPSSAMC
jgi:hypothetical protein